MKKHILPFRLLSIFLVLIISVGMLNSCGKALAYDRYDYDLNEYINTGDLSQIEVSAKEVETAVMNSVNSIAWNNSLYTELTDGTVQTYDVLVVDFTCAIDGLAIDAFASKDAKIYVGSGSMIEGFEEGLIGMAVGDEPRVMTLTFPEEYHSDLGGKEAVYTVTLKKISRPHEITDELVRKYTDYDTLSEMKEVISKLRTAEIAFNIIYERTEVKKYPETEYKYYHDDVAYLETYAKEQKMTVEEFLSKYGDQFSEFGFYKGMTEAEYKEECDAYAKRNVKEQMIVYYVLRELNVKTTGKPYNDMKKRILRDYNMSNKANYEEVYGEGSLDSGIRYNLMLNALYDRVVTK